MISPAEFTDKHRTALGLDHPWAQKYRVPVLSHYSCGVFVIAGLVVPDPDMPDYLNLNYVTPTEEDAQLLGDYIQHRIQTWYYPNYANQMAQYPVDVDPGVNTVTFMKTADRGWLYHRMTWDQPPAPLYGSKIRYNTLMDVIEAERGPYSAEKWSEWYAQHQAGRTS